MSWLAPDVHEEILAEYARWGPELGGVRGAPASPPRPAKLTILWRRLFGIGGWWPEGSGRMRSGFFVEGVSSSESVRRLEYFEGWFMSYRREVFEHERFDENLAGYAFKEDIDFSYRVVKRGYVLVQTPRARIVHHKSPSDRLSVLRPPTHGAREPVLPPPEEHASDTEVQGRPLVGAGRLAPSERRENGEDARQRLPDRLPGRRVGAGPGSRPHRPGGRGQLAAQAD